MNSTIDRRISEILGRVAGLENCEIKREPITLIQSFASARRWPDWASNPGIYFFELDGKLQYVGRAIRTTLGQRLGNQSTAFGNEKWDAVIKNPSSIVGWVALPPNEWYWAAALEAALISELRPKISKRIS